MANKLKVRHSCSGVKLTGYFKGFKCGSHAQMKVKGKWYCRLHSWFVVNQPEVFDKARKSAERKLTAINRKAAD